ncbi:hypothetical protein EsDP_00001784 [Epichloe bromicola]|uniref:Aminoglycoside phosphotransferase domain-containing protein n=1 Tax=Epichloe bromicola TaxID=79588 RepID=A0ABQ0CIU7_9HYPO
MSGIPSTSGTAGPKDEFFQELLEKTPIIEAIVRSQLGVHKCRVAHRDAWGCGGSHVAIPCRLTPNRSVYFRLPVPDAVGEKGNPGNVNECISTQIASYLWIHENCPDVPIPTLHSFGLDDGSVFTHPSNTPFWARLRWRVKRLIRFLRGAAKPISHILRTSRHQLGHGFLITSAAQGDSVALSWLERCGNAAYRQNLFRGLARAQLSLAAIPFPRIGCLSLQRDASIALTNRPLTAYILDAEMKGAVPSIPRHRTYGASSVYIEDLISLQDNLLRSQKNAMDSADDGQRQLAALTMLRATAHLFTSEEFREGPFPFMFTEMHMPNIFTDELGNVETIIDVETAALPREMLTTPRWLLLGRHEACSEMTPRDMLDEYLAIFTDETNRLAVESVKRYPGNEGAIQRVWFFSAVTMPGAMYYLFNRYIQPLFNKEHPDSSEFDEAVYSYWSLDAEAFINQKLRERKSDESSL